MQEEVEQRIVSLMISCGKLGEQEFRKAVAKLLEQLKSDHQKHQYSKANPHGKMTVKQLAAKEKGYAEDISEISDSLHCVAVPILTPHGGLWAISLSGHCSVIREYGVENIVKHLKKAVWDMTSGYSAAPVA